MGTTRAGEGGVGTRGGEHRGEAVLVEAVVTLEEERVAVVLVAGLVDRAVGDLQFFLRREIGLGFWEGFRQRI